MIKTDLKAYVVRDEYELDACVVFTSTPGKAKQKALNILDCEFIDLSARCEPMFDKYAEQGVVPQKVLFENGWWFEEICSKCGRRFILEHTHVSNSKIQINFDNQGNFARVVCENCGKEESE